MDVPQALAWIAGAEKGIADPSIDPASKAELQAFVSLIKSRFTASRDIDAKLAAIVAEKQQAARQTLATAIKAALPGLYRENCPEITSS